MPIFELIKKVKPNVVSVAFDPEGSGPDTHYKALQAVAEALRMYEKESGDSNITRVGIPERLVPVPTVGGGPDGAGLAELAVAPAHGVHELLRLPERGVVPELRARRAVLGACAEDPGGTVRR